MDIKLLKQFGKILNGISSDYPMDPHKAAKMFELRLSEEQGLEFVWDQIDLGYVHYEDEPMMVVYWYNDGVSFGEHVINGKTWDVLVIALSIITELDNQYMIEDSSTEEVSESNDDDDEWL